MLRDFGALYPGGMGYCICEAATFKLDCKSPELLGSPDHQGALHFAAHLHLISRYEYRGEYLPPTSSNFIVFPQILYFSSQYDLFSSESVLIFVYMSIGVFYPTCLHCFKS